MRSWKPLLTLAVVVIAVLLWNRFTGTPPPAAPASAAATAASSSDTSTLPGFLPPEARDTLALIARGGPFPHSQDGVVFGNYEHLLPEQPRGYYHEYTVETPGARTRGTRRIITGGTPPEAYYYTDDHYRSFRQFSVPR
ncbi:ribonuclease domain-containing protein [Rhodanobacter sp. DHG33]|uniref:ribonuclease domain-containing protein n=1 Tax=Rhodanobacter sp. DHG33 TaxID=2775921 RepID=UPI001781CD9B|nr:ribonuclease domain-containing protein [Rhodanobacter sp. DHG33]MBD8900143.1 ribonuclease [Rhodanobacter sp. DHG33]